MKRHSFFLRAAMMLLVALFTATTAWAQGVDYIDADGTLKNTATDGIDGNDTPTEINSSNMPTSFAAGWYVVTEDVTYTETVSPAGDVHLILADNCHMNIGTSETRLHDEGIHSNYDESLTIYSQSLGTDMGTLSIYTAAMFGRGIFIGTLTINGGNITADTDGKYAYALSADYLTINNGNITANTAGVWAYALQSRISNVTINGGTISATTTGEYAHAINAYEDFNYNGGTVTADATGVDAYAISALGKHYNFSWTSPSDRITIGASGLRDYYDPAAPDPEKITAATFSKLFTDGTSLYSGDYASGNLDAFCGKTLRPILTGECGATSSDNLTWIYDDYAKTLTISGTGDMQNFENAINQPWSSYNKDIQNIVIGDGVTGIGQHAFSFFNNTNYTRLIIPANVKSIGQYAFSCSPNLTTITIGTGVTHIDGFAFYSCSHVTDVYCYADPTNLTWNMPMYDFMLNRFTICHVADVDAWSGFTNVNVTFRGDLAPAVSTNNANDAYWSTYYNTTANVKADVYTTVYKAKIEGNSVVLSKINDRVINQGEAVVLKRSIPGDVIMLTHTDASTADYSDNELQGTEAAIAQEAGYNYYVLSKKNDVFGFYKLASTKQLGAGKAFLKVGANAAREFYGIGDETTALEQVENNQHSTFNSQQVYDLSGRRVEKPTRGLYIVNGRKVVIK